MKKFISEFIGTCLLTLIGCASIVLLGSLGIKNWESVVPVALTFGLTLTGIYYAFANISGAHVNPAVSLGIYLSGGLKSTEFLGYIASQFVGGIAGAGILTFIVMQCEIGDITTVGLGANVFGSGQSVVSINIVGAVVVELLLTFSFVLIYLNVANNEKFKGVAGIVIGVSFTAFYLISILFTGGSLNPARSLGPALILLTLGSSSAIEKVAIFVFVPFVAAAFSAILYLFLNGKSQKVEIVAPELVKKEEPKTKQPAAKKSATKAKPVSPSRTEKAEETSKRKGFFTSSIDSKRTMTKVDNTVKGVKEKATDKSASSLNQKEI